MQNDINEVKYHEINSKIEITFDVPEILLNLMKDAEAADIRNDGSYDNFADTIDVCSKNCYTDGKITKDQWNMIIRRYPQ